MVQVLMPQVYQVLALALLLLEQELQVLLQLRERLAEFEPAQRVPVLKQLVLVRQVPQQRVPEQLELLVQQAQLCELN
jgi:hypothetical protein